MKDFAQVGNASVLIANRVKDENDTTAKPLKVAKKNIPSFLNI